MPTAGVLLLGNQGSPSLLCQPYPQLTRNEGSGLCQITTDSTYQQPSRISFEWRSDKSFLPLFKAPRTYRKMVTITLYTRQQKRHWCIEQSYGLFGRGRGWEDLGEWHWNMYNITYETSRQSRFNARYWMLRAGAMGRPRGMVWGGRRAEGSGWGTHVYLWRIHFDIWQNQYNIVKFKNKIKLKKK